MNRNVLTWLTEEVPEARHALILTHNISFLFAQSILLSKLRAAGNPRVTIFADAGCAGSAWRQDRALLCGLGVQYRVVPVDLGAWRRFHPKALLLADRTRAVLAIGSGNLTQGGMGSNREAWVFGATDDDGAPRIATFRTYLAGLIDTLRLAAALSLWCVTEWSARDRDALWFRLSAAQLQARWPFLFAAGDPDVMANELQAMSAALLPPNEQAECAKTWREVVRAGKALELLSDSLKRGSLEAFQRVAANLWLEPGDLVWAGKALAFPTVRIRHEASANIPVRPLGGAKETKFKGGFVFPVRRLLEAGILDLPPAALPEITRLVGDFESAEPVAG